MDKNTRKRYFSVLSNRDVGIEFPVPKQRKPIQIFSPGDTVIITTNCEDIELHGLTGVVSWVSKTTGSVYVRMDVDQSSMPFSPGELGHRF